jgi:pimeloyl-ACP methyl ester carboxylesterase
VPDQFIRDVKRMTFSSYEKTYDESAEYVEDGDLARDFKRIRVPTMIVFGGRDRLVEPSSARGYMTLRAVRSEVISGAGHAVMVEQPRAVASLLRDFSQRPAGGPSSRGGQVEAAP